ncbi:MAG: hypothetical protein IKL26_01605, partial [Bacteroidales bacterium]|nr:hypothetical protein [Bacteroidales bacterium]
VDADGDGTKEAYHWLSMSYILVNDTHDVDEDKDGTIGDYRTNLESLEYTFTPASGNAIEFAEGLNNVPVQRNWRTNILGKILTGDIQFNITIDPVYDGDINVEDNWADGYSYEETTGTYHVYNTEGMIAVAALVDEATDGFEGKTILLENDIDLSAANWNPMGDNRTDNKAFKGIFDGQNHMISGAHITGDHCWDGSVYGSKEGWGLFSVLDGASVKNLKMDGATFASYTVISGAIAGYAKNTTFENIEISNTKIAGYNWYTGGVVGWAEGECTFKNVNLDNTVSVGTLWDSHGQSAGGIAGGISEDAVITIEDCNIACVLDVINDVTSNYKWYIYRVSGMIIGNTNTTEAQYNTVVTATATNVTCKNVTVTYGDWMNYHYCQGYWNRGWGRVESSDYVSGIDHTQCNHPAGEQHYVCIPFNQLFGGSSNGSGHYPVKGLASFPGVTVNYPASFITNEIISDLSNVTSEKTVDLTSDLSVSSGNTIHTQNAAAAITINGNGNSIVSTANSADDFQWEGGTIPAMSTIFSSANGSKVTVNDLSFEGTMSALMLGHYQNATYNNYNTELNNVNVINTKVVSFSAGVSPAVCVYGTAVLNNCNIYGTTLSELDTDPMWPVYDVAAVNYSTTTVNGGKIGSLLFWNQAALIVNDKAVIEKLVIRGNMNNNNANNYIKINSGAEVKVIDLSNITDKNRVKITIEDGATVGKIVANGVEYNSITEYKGS